jgi:hypothetical protein
MTGLQIREAQTTLHDGYLAPHCRASGETRSSLFQPEGFSLWEVEAELGPGAVVTWDADHGDEVVYVLDGAIEVGSQGCGARGAVIVEAGADASLRAVTASRMLHYGPVSTQAPTDGPLGPARTTGHGVHVIGAEKAEYNETTDGTRSSAHYADSTCDTCRVAFFENDFRTPAVVSSHTHSQDEIIRMLTGTIHMGRVALDAAMSVAIPGDHRYGFRSTGPFSFLNYRRDASLYVGAPGNEPLLETVDTVRRVRSGAITIE